MPNIKKILVIGASVAKPAVSFWLREFGFEPTLIVRHESLRKGDYAKAFTRYQTLLTPFVDANQLFGAWVSETYLAEDPGTKAIAEERSDMVMERLKMITNAIPLPEYDDFSNPMH